MTTDLDNAGEFCQLLYCALRDSLSDTAAVLQRVADIESHAPRHTETRFCKDCVLPVVDSVATHYLQSKLGLTLGQIRSALRCEGVSTLAQVYTPAVGQSGFSTFTWGTNYQRVSKTGKAYPPDSRGYQPCPDFGIVHREKEKFALVGETKFSRGATSSGPLLADICRDLRYYVGLPSQPGKSWDYDFGFGIAYAAGGDGPRQCRLFVDEWEKHRFVVACFSGMTLAPNKAIDQMADGRASTSDMHLPPIDFPGRAESY
ncbi:MAG TPA: hypothetical protein VM940_00260 [Chthoniobacterales bacterium]|jgi:hypothetical protein|nr:hypothetical protein [Chthoniobacterales bacterium]